MEKRILCTNVADCVIVKKQGFFSAFCPIHELLNSEMPLFHSKTEFHFPPKIENSIFVNFLVFIFSKKHFNQLVRWVVIIFLALNKLKIPCSSNSFSFFPDPQWGAILCTSHRVPCFCFCLFWQSPSGISESIQQDLCRGGLVCWSNFSIILPHNTSYWVTQYKRPYGDMPPTLVAKSASQYINNPLFYAKYGIWMGQFFQISKNLSQNKFKKIWKKKKGGGNFGQNSAQNRADWYMNGSLFLGKLVLVWIKFQIPSGTSLPKPNLSYPPGTHIMHKWNLDYILLWEKSWYHCIFYT